MQSDMTHLKSIEWGISLLKFLVFFSWNIYIASLTIHYLYSKA